MAEARRWAPELKVLRFHGPVKERDRLKRIAAGEIDMFGNLTSKQKVKLRTRRTAAGKPVISLDSESEGEEEEFGKEEDRTGMDTVKTNEGLGVDLVVTTYDAYLAEQAWFKRAFVWRYVILDEGHKVKVSSEHNTYIYVIYL
jgi:SWI/SNF-related matrix-associated actin-dependent regulator of chromatin subfamily A member 5